MGKIEGGWKTEGERGSRRERDKERERESMSGKESEWKRERERESLGHTLYRGRAKVEPQESLRNRLLTLLSVSGGKS